MVLDSSPIVSFILQDAHYDWVCAHLDNAETLLVAPPTLVETAIVIANRLKTDPVPLIAAFLRNARVEVVPFTHVHYEAAASAFLRYGKGRHPAALNYGDCMAYAVARVAGLPLLYTGNDFSKTDLPRR
jgi:ribonuclease VapC